MNVLDLTLKEIKQGYRKENTTYRCNYCDESFHIGGMYELAGSYYTADKMIANHIEQRHDGNRTQLIHSDSKYNTLTAKQKDLLTEFGNGKKDQSIADKMKISPSTVRHQKFTFREKAKQAKLYLAMYETVFNAENADVDPLLSVPQHAKVVDDRFAITEDEYATITKQYFDFSSGHTLLKKMPKGQKKIIAILNRVIEELEMDKKYSHQEMDQLLQDMYFDYVSLRRYLVDYGFLGRTVDGQIYWREC